MSVEREPQLKYSYRLTLQAGNPSLAMLREPSKEEIMDLVCEVLGMNKGKKPENTTGL
jgi:hypothetical protein